MPTRHRACLIALLAAALGGAMPAAARDNLGMFGAWGAFRDPQVPRCYAIARSDAGRDGVRGYADIGNWPRRATRGRVHLRLSRRVAANAAPVLAIGGTRIPLATNGLDAWPQDPRADAAVVAAMRSAASFRVSAHDAAGRPFSDSFPLDGAPSAIDAAAVGCARG